jgi:replicative DNA helicase|tara:strand:+ start:3791 stop:5209 length:1419 start_codon:yes stop_codon:yes gene_type:complete
MVKKEEKKTLGFLGNDFQTRLLANVVTDHKFAYDVIDILKPEYFEDQYFRKLYKFIKDNYQQTESICDFSSLEMRVNAEMKGNSPAKEAKRELFVAQLNKIKGASLNDGEYIKKTGLDFCKQQELQRVIYAIQKIIDTGDISQYFLCEELIKEALEMGDNRDDAISVFNKLSDVLSDDFRLPIPTGIEGMDEAMDGGLAKGELGVILAPYGVGKTTFMTKIANTAFNEGKKVLQIFFEDNPKVIQRKHLACWSNINLNDLSARKDEVAEIAKEREATGAEKGGEIKLKKMSSNGTTIAQIRQYVRKLISNGWKPDLIIVDYIDCVEPDRRYDDINQGEGAVMRAFESMLADLDIVGWTAVQGNRSSIGAEVVEGQQMGGSIKRGQIGHFIVSIAKTLDQKEAGTATLAIIKSRFGKDGIIWYDITFNNGTMQIDTSTSSGPLSQSEGIKHKDNKRDELVKNLMNKKDNVLNQ